MTDEVRRAAERWKANNYGNGGNASIAAIEDAHLLADAYLESASRADTGGERERSQATIREYGEEQHRLNRALEAKGDVIDVLTERLAAAEAALGEAEKRELYWRTECERRIDKS